MSFFGSSAPRHGLTRVEIALGALAVIACVFYLRQNAGAQIGGQISLPKILWLNYALAAFFVVPAFLWRSPVVSTPIRRIYGWHLGSFALRGLLEMWMLYAVHTWRPPYGIGHDVFQIALIVALLLVNQRSLSALNSPADTAALRFLTTIRLALLAEILFATLFYRVTQATTGPNAVYYADNTRAFLVINIVTAIVAVVAYRDLLITLRRFRTAGLG